MYKLEEICFYQSTLTKEIEIVPLLQKTRIIKFIKPQLIIQDKLVSKSKCSTNLLYSYLNKFINP